MNLDSSAKIVKYILSSGGYAAKVILNRMHF